jgi:hypothetical protein
MEASLDQDLVYSLAVSPAFGRDGVSFAARTSGLYRSDDGGFQWRGLYSSLKLGSSLTTLVVAVSPAFESDRTVFAGVQGGVLCSTDGGETWRPSLLPNPPPLVTSLAVSPNFPDDGTILAGTMEDGVFRSSDRGSRWAAWNFGLLDMNILSLAVSPDFARDETLFAGTESGIFRSTNGGRAWREVSFPSEAAPVLCLGLSPDFAKDGLAFAGTEAQGLFRSTDQGGTWEPLGEEGTTGEVRALMLVQDSASGLGLLVLGQDDLVLSRDGGQSWSRCDANLPAEKGMTCLAAPMGADVGSPLLIGLEEGGVARVEARWRPVE